MYSNSDFIFDDFAVTRHNSNKFDSRLSKIEKVWFLYKAEGEPKGIPINSFCVNQGVLYSQFNDGSVVTVRPYPSCD